MAVTDVSPAYKNAVSSFLEGLQYLVGPDGSRTECSYRAYIRGVLQPADTRQVRTGICTPVAQKTDDSRLELIVGHDHSNDPYPL
jgi:hypothetical protein